MAGTMTITVRGGRSPGAGLLFLTTTGLVSGLVGATVAAVGGVIPAGVAVFVLVVVALVYACVFLLRGRQPYLPWPKQLPARWINRKRPYVTATRYGIAWGLTFTTPIRTGSMLVLTLLVLALESPVLGFSAFAVVGLVKAYPTALRPLRPPKEPGAWNPVPAVRRALFRGLDILAVMVAAGWAIAWFFGETLS